MKPVNHIVIAKKLAQLRRDEAQVLYHALMNGKPVSLGFGEDADGRPCVTGEADGRRVFLPVARDDAAKVAMLVRNLDKPAARALLARVALDAWNPEGKAHRAANGYP